MLSMVCDVLNFNLLASYIHYYNIVIRIFLKCLLRNVFVTHHIISMKSIFLCQIKPFDFQKHDLGLESFHLLTFQGCCYTATGF
jgi:hypothetical protein